MSGFKKYIFNSETLSYEVDRSYTKRRAFRVVFLLVLSSLMAFFNLWILTGALGLELPKTTILKKKNAALLSQVEVLGTSIREYDERLMSLQMRDNDIYRTVLGMGKIAPEVRNAGFSGANRYLWLDDSEYNTAFRSAVVRTDILMKKAYIQSKSTRWGVLPSVPGIWHPAFPSSLRLIRTRRNITCQAASVAGLTRNITVRHSITGLTSRRRRAIRSMPQGTA